MSPKRVTVGRGLFRPREHPDMKRLFILSAFALCATGFVAQAQQDVIKARQDLMKASLQAARPTFGMLRGQAPYDAAVVQNALTVLEDSGKKAPALFPETSKTGDTNALPAIWERKAEFNGLFAKMAQDAAAAKGRITSEATFKAEYPKVVGTCQTCHDSFQKPN